MEEYLETIFRLEQTGTAAKTGTIAKQLDVAPPSVTDMIQRLEKSDYVTYEPYKGVRLTDAGREIGRRQLEKHRVMQAFLQTVCGMAHAEAHEAACDMEHTIPEPLEAWMAQYLQDAHGLSLDTARKVGEQVSTA